MSITSAIEHANADGRMALAVYVTAGFPTKSKSLETLKRLVEHVDVLEIGVPFSDPMADGVSIQRASFEALKQGVTLEWIFEVATELQGHTPIILMSYLNPLLAHGEGRLGTSARSSGVSGYIIPDLPHEEAKSINESLVESDVDLIQLVTPATSLERMQRLCLQSRGFVYAVTSTGTTGGDAERNQSLPDYLDLVTSVSPVPVLAGFGIRHASHIRDIAGHAHGVVVGSAIVEALARDDDVIELVKDLIAATRLHKGASI